MGLQMNCRRGVALVLAGGLVGAVGASPLWASWGRAEAMPDWVTAAVKAAPAEFPQSAKAAVLLQQITYTVGPDGRAVEHVRRVVKILRPQGREYGYPFVSFDKDSKVTSMHVWSIDPAGHTFAMKDNELLEVGQPGEGGELYSDEKAKVADPPGRDPGGIVAYEYERKERPYLAEANWEFQDELPRVQQSFTLVLPPGYTYTTSWAHHAKVDAADLENHSYRWEMDNETALDTDHVPLAPDQQGLAARMTVHYSGPGLSVPQDGTWQGIGEWYAALAQPRLVATPEITTKAQELVAGKTDFYDKAQAIGEFVQKKVRYFVIEMGVGGYQPHPAEDIFRNRYGDCKDKAALLTTMLASVGMHGAMLMVDTNRGVVDPKAPSIAGNHMIAAIELPKGYESPKLHSVVTAQTGKRYLIFDPTWEATPFGQVEDNLQGSYGVLVEGADSQVIQIPVMPPSLNSITRTGTFKLSADGSLQGDVTDRRFGDVAERRRHIFGAENATKQQQFIDKQVGEDLTGATVSALTVQNVDSLDKDLTTHFDLQTQHFASATGPLLMVRPRVLGSYELDVDHKVRKLPIDLYETLSGSDDYDIALPPGYVVDELPDPVKQDFGFASYESSTVVQGSTLHYSRKYVLRQITLPADRYSDVQRLASVIAADEDSRVVLKKAQ